MKHYLFLLLCLCTAFNVTAEEYFELLPYGDFDSWAVRYIKESRFLGGKTKVLYAVAPVDTIRENKVFVYGTNGNPWTVSNAYAKVAGVEKASNTTSPEKRDKGWCARLDTKLETVTALGIIDLKVQVSGTVFTGQTLEPVTMKGANDPYSVINMGVPFTKHPVAIQLDYKAKVEDSDVITYAKATSHPKTRTGRDCAEFYTYFQYRWEDEKGNIFAKRVGTAYERIWHSVPAWQNAHRIPVRWGDITKMPDYKDYEGLNQHAFKALNSKGQMVPIQEVGYGTEEPTHMILFLTSGRYEAFVGHNGNTVWVDNVGLVYKK